MKGVDMSAFRSQRRGASATDIIFGLVVLGLFVAGGWWLMKTMGQAGEQYAKGMIQARDRGTAIKCQTNLHSVWQLMQTQATAEGTYPQSRGELERLCGDSRLLRCPDPNGGDYVYLPPGRIDDPTPHVILYDPKPVHEGKCCILVSTGEIGFLTPEELRAALGRVRPSGR